MATDFIEELLQAVSRVVPPDAVQLKEVLIVCGMPERTQNLRYLNFNRQIHMEADRMLEFSAVAVVNNPRLAHWQLTGAQKMLSRLVFGTAWTHNPLDYFINNLRCDAGMTELLAGAASAYTLLGILETTAIHTNGKSKFKDCTLRPVVALPRLTTGELSVIEAFEKANTVRKKTLGCFQLFTRA